MRWNFLHNSTLPIGVDLGASGVKLMQLHEEGGLLRVVAAARRNFLNPLSDEPQQRRSEIERAMQGALEMSRFRGDACVLAPSASDLLIRAVRLPSMTDDERRKAVKWEASERFTVPMDELEVESIRAGEVAQGHDTRDEVILIASRRTNLATCLDAVLGAGLRPLAVDAPFLASCRTLTRSLRRQEDESVVRLIIDVGLSVTTVCITRGRETAFVKPIDIAGRDFNRAVSDRLSLDPEAAKQLRIERMAESSEPATRESTGGGQRQPISGGTADRVSRAAFEAIRPLMHDLAQEAALCLRYYSVTFRGARPEYACIIGGESREPNLASILSEHLKLEARVISPLEGIDVTGAEMRLDRRHASLTDWAVAAGLSMRGASMFQSTYAPLRRSGSARPAPPAASGKRAAA